MVVGSRPSEIIVINIFSYSWPSTHKQTYIFIMTYKIDAFWTLGHIRKISQHLIIFFHEYDIMTYWWTSTKNIIYYLLFQYTKHVQNMFFCFNNMGLIIEHILQHKVIHKQVVTKLFVNSSNETLNLPKNRL